MYLYPPVSGGGLCEFGLRPHSPRRMHPLTLPLELAPQLTGVHPSVNNIIIHFAIVHIGRIQKNITPNNNIPAKTAYTGLSKAYGKKREDLFRHMVLYLILILFKIDRRILQQSDERYTL